MENKSRDMKVKIYIVDDESDILNNINIILKKYFDNAETQTFENGAEVYNQIIKDQPDLLITDIQMPKMDGLTLIEKIRSDGFNFPILIVSGHYSTDQEAKVILDCMEKEITSGAFNVMFTLRKPFKAKEFIEIVDIIINKYISKKDSRDKMF